MTFRQRHPLLYLYLFFAYFSVPYQLLIYVSGMSGFIGLRQSLIVSILWLIPMLLWPSKTKLLAAIIASVLWLPALIAFSYWLIYGQDFSQSVLFIIFETNTAEGIEFIMSYLKPWHCLVFFLITLVPVLLWKKIPVLSLSHRTRYSLIGLFSLIIISPFLNNFFIRDTGYEVAESRWLKGLEPASPWNLAVGYKYYRVQLNEMNQLLAENKKIEPLKNFTTNPALLPDTLVLVIGESTNRQRMGLYGYSRKTSPKLTAIKDEMVIFDDVVSARPYTIESLQQALSFADSKSTTDFFTRPTLLNIMKQAGYEITWITNQQTQTKRNTMLTMLSQLADHQVYLNNNRAQNSSQYDEVVLKPFLKTLSTNASHTKKMIVVHLLGTHRKYSYRYPKTFNKFTSNQNIPAWITDDIIDEYNSYDNAILYNDTIINRLIDGLKAQNNNAFLMYFSDHGEEVFDSPAELFTGRNESQPTPAMYTVPFIVWSSANYAVTRNTAEWQTYRHRPFSLADVIHTLPDMIGIQFDDLQYDRSLISKHFLPHNRWIGDPLRPKTLQDFNKIVDNQ